MFSLNSIVTSLMLAVGGGGGLSLNNLLKNLTNSGRITGVLLVAGFGLIVFVVSLVGIGRNFLSHDSNRQPKWGYKIGGLIVGGSMLYLSGDSFGIWDELAQGGQQTLEDAARGNSSGVVIPDLVLK